ncbi:MAG TPA: hypothetical protein VMN39_05555 [Longimicrobiaceae bacterium]|nr:hypothetical protein [Longimicrobiaceae bacterium]
MTDQDPQTGTGRSTGDRRGRDRRSSDRRKEDRRSPVPPWRRPAAFVAYGVVATLVLVLLFSGGEETVQPFPNDPESLAAVRAENARAMGVGQPADRQAVTVADFESLVAEGDAAVGSVVEAELFCGSLSSIALRDVEGIDPRLAALADSDRRVPAAECRWSREARSTDLLLVVPPQLAAEFARAPEVELNFVRRRRVPADVLWLGRSEGLALRTAGILSRIRTTER